MTSECPDVLLSYLSSFVPSHDPLLLVLARIVHVQYTFILFNILSICNINCFFNLTYRISYPFQFCSFGSPFRVLFCVSLFVFFFFVLLFFLSSFLQSRNLKLLTAHDATGQGHMRFLLAHAQNCIIQLSHVTTACQE